MLIAQTSECGVPISELKFGSERKVRLKCNTCGIENVTSYHNYALSQKKFGRNGETYCRTCAIRARMKLRRGIKLGPKDPAKIQFGEAHHAWRGGRFVASDGYVQVNIGKKKYRKEHFLVIEKALGRSLQRTEVVHHIDGSKINNSLNNLVLLSNESAHQQVHNSLYRLSLEMVRAGLITFDRQSNTYMAVGKLRELLEQPAEVNQQPSLGSNSLEGSTTRDKSQADKISTSAQQSID